MLLHHYKTNSASFIKPSADEIFKQNLLRFLAVLFFVTCVVRTTFYDTFFMVVNSKGIANSNFLDSDITHSIILWGHNIAILAFPMAAFFKSRLFKNISVFFSLPFAIGALLNFDKFMWYFTQEGGSGFVLPEGFRQFFLAFELSIAIIFPLLLIVLDRHYMDVYNKKEVGAFFLALPLVIIKMCPVSIPQSLFGLTKLAYNALSVGNLVWVALLVIEVVVLYRVFRFKNYRSRYMLCVFLSLVTLMSVSPLFMMGFDITRLPLQLNNLCGSLLIVALIIKKQRFFNFVFLASVACAALAILSATTPDGSATSFWAYKYYIAHTELLVTPILCTILRVFPRVNNSRAIRNLTEGLVIYSVICLLVGTLLNGFLQQVGGEPRVNYMFMFDPEWLRNIDLVPSVVTFQLKLGRFVLYPIYQLSVLFGMWLLCIVVYFFMQKIYDVVDDYFVLRRAKIELQERITNKKSNAFLEYID